VPLKLIAKIYNTGGIYYVKEKLNLELSKNKNQLGISNKYARLFKQLKGQAAKGLKGQGVKGTRY